MHVRPRTLALSHLASACRAAALATVILNGADLLETALSGFLKTGQTVCLDHPCDMVDAAERSITIVTDLSTKVLPDPCQLSVRPLGAESIYCCVDSVFVSQRQRMEIEMGLSRNKPCQDPVRPYVWLAI